MRESMREGATQSVSQSRGQGGGAPPVRVPSWAWPVITLCALLLGTTAIIRGTSAIVHASDSDLTNFFFPSAQYILQGSPFHIYAVNVGGYPDYNPPLSIFLMAPLLALARQIGFAANYGEQITFVALPFIVLVPVLGYLVLRALRRLYPAIPETQALLAYALVVLSPLTWQTYGTWYHVEQPLMLCFLIGAVLALQRRQPALAGVLAALAVLSRTTALMPLLALGVLLLIAREWRTLVTFAFVGAALTLAALAPFFLVDPTDTKYSLLTWRGGAPLGGNTIWALFSYGDTHGHLLTLISSVAKHLDMYVVVLFILVVAAYAAWRWKISAFDRDAWAVMTVAFLAVPMLSKTSWPYYFLEPFILLVVWEFASMHDRRAGVWRWPVLSLLYLVIAATLSQYIGLRSVGYGDRVIVGLLETGVLLAFAALVGARIQARKEAAQAPVLAGAVMSSGGARAAEWPSPSPRPPTERVPASSSFLRAGAEVPPGGPPSPPWSPVSQTPGSLPLSAPVAPPSVPLAPPPGYAPGYGPPGPSTGAGAAGGAMPPNTPPNTPPSAPYPPRWQGDVRAPGSPEGGWPAQPSSQFPPQPPKRGWGGEPGPTPPQER